MRRVVSFLLFPEIIVEGRGKPNHLSILFDLESCKRNGNPEPSLDSEHPDEGLVNDQNSLSRCGEEGCCVVEGEDGSRVDGWWWQCWEEMRWWEKMEGLEKEEREQRELFSRASEQKEEPDSPSPCTLPLLLNLSQSRFGPHQ